MIFFVTQSAQVFNSVENVLISLEKLINLVDINYNKLKFLK